MYFPSGNWLVLNKGFLGNNLEAIDNFSLQRLFTEIGGLMVGVPVLFVSGTKNM